MKLVLDNNNNDLNGRIIEKENKIKELETQLDAIKRAPVGNASQEDKGKLQSEKGQLEATIERLNKQLQELNDKNSNNIKFYEEHMNNLNQILGFRFDQLTNEKIESQKLNKLNEEKDEYIKQLYELLQNKEINESQLKDEIIKLKNELYLSQNKIISIINKSNLSNHSSTSIKSNNSKLKRSFIDKNNGPFDQKIGKVFKLNNGEIKYFIKELSNKKEPYKIDEIKNIFNNDEIEIFNDDIENRLKISLNILNDNDINNDNKLIVEKNINQILDNASDYLNNYEKIY